MCKRVSRITLAYQLSTTKTDARSANYTASEDHTRITLAYQLLRAYAAYDTEVGYCQSLNYLAAILMLYMDEEGAFWALQRTVQWALLVGYYTNGMVGLRTGHQNSYIAQLHQLKQGKFDEEGVLHYIATKGRTVAYTNPHNPYGSDYGSHAVCSCTGACEYKRPIWLWRQSGHKYVVVVKRSI